MTPRKSESTRLVLRLTHDDADALSASLVTEAELIDFLDTHGFRLELDSTRRRRPRIDNEDRVIKYAGKKDNR